MASVVPFRAIDSCVLANEGVVLGEGVEYFSRSRSRRQMTAGRGTLDDGADGIMLPLNFFPLPFHS